MKKRDQQKIDQLDSHKVPHLLLVDDDPMFRTIVARMAKERGFAVTTCCSSKELKAMAEPDLFDLAIVDYYLDNIRPHLKGTEIAEVMPSTPVLLVSSCSHCLEEGEAWPSSIRSFSSKANGIEAVLNDAAQLIRKE